MKVDCLARDKVELDIWYEESDVEKYRKIVVACLINKTYITNEESMK